MHVFRAEWPPNAIDRLREQVRIYQYPPAPADAGWRYGCDPAFLRDLCAYWRDGYDFRAAQEDLNRFPQFTAEIEPGVDLHFVHIQGEAGGKRPLLLIHGWPGSHIQFWRVTGPLAFPSRHGGRAEDAFDLVIPSLPGFGFSFQPSAPVGARTTARWFDRLMRNTLGYDRYLVSGTDWGSAIAPWMALDHPQGVRAIHFDLMMVRPPALPATGEELAWSDGAAAHEAELGAYSHLQATRPQSLAYLAAASPAGQAAWIVERFHDWADLRQGSLESLFGRDWLLTNIMLYVMDDRFTTAAWFYAGSAEEGARQMPEERRIDIPTGFAAYPDPRRPPPPRSLVEKGYNLVHWAQPQRGGHFAALEVPDVVVADLRAWAARIG